MTNEHDLRLMDVLQRVPALGWAGAVAEAAYPGGVVEAIDAFAAWADRAMEASLEGTAVMEMKIRDRIALMVRLRLEALEPYREAVRREAAWLSTHRPDLAAWLVWRTAHRMWGLAGDTATDFNHYSKRGLLCGVIASTTLCWLGDETPGHADTWDFLGRRIENVMGIGKAIGKAKGFADPSAVLDRIVEFAGRVRYRG
jgi:ubiquinone biosynthesis protein COQ9